MRKLIVLCCFIIGFTSCKTKKIVGDAGGIKRMSVKKITKYNRATFANYKTISAKIKAKFVSDKVSMGFAVNLRIETDKMIWMSVKKFGIPMAKLKITPEKVQFYEKLSQTYFEGDFSLISDFFGMPLDFEQVQNILIGKPLLTFKNKQLVVGVSKGDYVLSLKKKQELYALFFHVNPKDFTLSSQQLKELSSSDMLKVNYPKFQHKIPKKIEIRVQEKNKKTFVDLDFKAVQFDKTLRFPFSIPQGYTKISLK